jgi:hypothetical protein
VAVESHFQLFWLAFRNQKQTDFNLFLHFNCAGSRKFENPLKPCCFGISSDYKCGNVDESGAKKYTVCEDPKATFFWDGAHPTQEGWSAVYSALQPNLEHLY